jgi:hypothetical protein
LAVIAFACSDVTSRTTVPVEELVFDGVDPSVDPSEARTRTSSAARLESEEAGVPEDPDVAERFQ